MPTPIIDIHCDLLCYLEAEKLANPLVKGNIGCTIPDLEEGNVALQIMAIYTATEAGSVKSALQQSIIFNELSDKCNNRISVCTGLDSLKGTEVKKNIKMLAAIENAAGLCEEDAPIETMFTNIDTITKKVGKIFYIGLTHHTENRFGGGNNTNIGLKDDGKVLLDWMHQQKIALDFSHTSDALAYDLLNYINGKNLQIPIIASHSNYREVFNHVRNLPDDIAQEIIKQNGLIGVNFLRAFMNNENPNAMFDHILHGIKLGGENAICFGADYFFTKHHPDQSRRPFYHIPHDNASKYPSIIDELQNYVSADIVEKISNKNVLNFMERVGVFGA